MGDPTLTDLASALGTASVEVEQLDRFRQQVFELSQGFAELAIEGVVSPLGEMPVNFAGGGLAEGIDFFSPYNDCVRQLGEFIGQASQGLASLSAVAMLVGVNYVTGDTESAELLATVTDAFEPPPLSTDPAAWAALAKHRHGQELEAARMEAEFEDMVEEYRDGKLSDDERDGFHLPYSDYYTVNPGPLRADGEFWPRPPGYTEPDVQNVRLVDLPDPANGQTVVDGLDLFDLTPPEYQDRVEAAQEEWTDGDGDFPGTSDDERTDDDGGRDPIF